jgi:hypothetical protein
MVKNVNPKNTVELRRRQAHMHQNLLNAGFEFVWYLSDKNENVQETESLNRSQRFCTRAFVSYMPAMNYIFRVKVKIKGGTD